LAVIAGGVVRLWEFGYVAQPSRTRRGVPAKLYDKNSDDDPCETDEHGREGYYFPGFAQVGVAAVHQASPNANGVWDRSQEQRPPAR